MEHWINCLNWSSDTEHKLTILGFDETTLQHTCRIDWYQVDVDWEWKYIKNGIKYKIEGWYNIIQNKYNIPPSYDCDIKISRRAWWFTCYLNGEEVKVDSNGDYRDADWNIHHIDITKALERHRETPYNTIMVRISLLEALRDPQKIDTDSQNNQTPPDNGEPPKIIVDDDYDGPWGRKYWP